MTKPLIDQAVDRFLGWKLPEDFHPDCGIGFTKRFNEGTPWPMDYEPSGTNLLTAIQAKSMLEHVAAPLLARIAELEAKSRSYPPEGCALEAVHTGDGWCLLVSYPEGHESHGEAIALLEWPESWPESVDGEFLRRSGFEVV